MSKFLAGRQSKPISTDATAAPDAADAGVPPGGARVHASFPEPPRRGLAAALASILLHVLVILLAIRLTQAVVAVKDSPAGNAIMKFIGGGGGGGGSGGAAITALTKPPPPPPPTKPPETPVVLPKVETVPDKVPPVEAPPAKVDTSHAPSTATTGAGTGGGSGGGQGTGTGTGRGSGEGPGSGSGKGGGEGGGRGGFDPVSKTMVLPSPNSPKELRGTSVEIRFSVAADGHVTDVEVKPAIKNKDYAKRFDESMRAYRFTPAKDETGKAVAGVAIITITF